MKKHILVVGLVVSLLCFGSTGFAYDLTEFGLQPAEVYDFGGNTVTIVSWTAERIKDYLTSNPVTIGRLEEAEALFNCKIEFLQTRDIPATNFNRLLSGESAYDLWFTQSRIGYYEIVSSGAAYPIGEELPDAYYSALSPYEEASVELLGYQGHNYGIGKMHFGSGVWNTGGIVMFYNKTLLEELGVEDPFELYAADEWTWDKATEILVAATQDLDGDGTSDVYGLTGVVPYSFVISNGGSVTDVDENGRIVFTLDREEAIEALELYVDWHLRGLVGGSFPNRTAAFYMRFISDGANYLNMEDEWSVVPFPRGPRADQYYFPEWSPETTVIPANAEQPEALAALKAFLFRPDDVTLNEVIARTVRDQNAARILMQLQTDWVPKARYLHEMFGGSMVEDALAQIRSGTKTPAVAVAEIKLQVQALLDDFQNQ
ncbi:MAG TPA: extracellular solute-binding protein [Firmicutes bacterium]|nr:extracellular solute-binding protein [Bacillota bacterium]